MNGLQQLNLFVVGPQGVGKTVICTMLNHFVVHNSSLGFTYRAANWATKQYFDDVQSALEIQKWPKPNDPGSLPKLEWEWLSAGRTARFVLVDPSGEDIQDELSDQSSRLGIIEEIKKSHVLFLLIDLHGHQADSPTKRALNAWIVEHVLKRAASTYRIVVGISKGDLWTHEVPSPSWQDKDRLLALIEALMPELNLNGYREVLTSERVHLVMFSAVGETEPCLESDGNLYRRPHLPLRSEGLEPFVEATREALGKLTCDAFLGRIKQFTLQVLRSPLFWKWAAAVLVAYLLYWWSVSNWGAQADTNFQYQTISQLFQHASANLRGINSDIVRKRRAANSHVNPFRDDAKRHLDEVEKQQQILLNSEWKCPYWYRCDHCDGGQAWFKGDGIFGTGKCSKCRGENGFYYHGKHPACDESFSCPHSKDATATIRSLLGYPTLP